MRLRPLAILLLAAIQACGIAAAEPVGAVSRLQGEAEADGAALSMGAGIDAGALLRTADLARLEVRFLDGTVLTLGERTAMRVDTYVYAPASGSGNVVFRLSAGSFLVTSGAVGKLPDRPLKIATPVATIGIRGTTFWGGSVDNPLEVLVLDGAVLVESSGGRVELNPGQGTTIRTAGAAPDAAIRWDKAKVERALGSVSFP
ncbi:MAG: FecR family protein [Magnetospirillum sp.]|nr:FecR family protein [Magnetospirillum sp.]